MKTKFKYLTLAVAALLMGFASCSNDDEKGGEDQGTPKNIFLKISNAAPTSYAQGPAQGATTVGFTSGNLFLANAAGRIVATYSLSSAATTGNNISLTDIKAGTILQDIPGNTTSVYVVGNTAITPAPTTVPGLESQVLQLASQSNVNSVNLYGFNSLTAPAGGNTYYTCDVTLKPTVARIELTDISAGGSITGFNVDGIFIDNYYSKGNVGGTLNVADLVSNGNAAAGFTGSSPVYPASLSGIVYDWNATPLAATANVVKPATAGNVWGYNLFASAAGATGDVPRIIIRLSGVTASNGITYADPQFVTIRGLLDTGIALTSIDAGSVYNIGAGAFTFTGENLAPEPNLLPIDVQVTITLVDWTVVPVTPEL